MPGADYHLKIDGIPGESKDKDHLGEIDVLSWSWGESNPGSFASGGGGGGGGRVDMQDFHFTMPVSKASPVLFKKCATGEHIKSGLLTCRKAGTVQQPYLQYAFTDLLISGFQDGGSDGSDLVPTNQISFNFAKVEMRYREQKADGTLDGPITHSYDLKGNQAG